MFCHLHAERRRQSREIRFPSLESVPMINALSLPLDYNEPPSFVKTEENLQAYRAKSRRMTKSERIYRRESEFVKYKGIKCILHGYGECSENLYLFSINWRKENTEYARKRGESVVWKLTKEIYICIKYWWFKIIHKESMYVGYDIIKCLHLQKILQIILRQIYWIINNLKWFNKILILLQISLQNAH